MSNSPTPSPLLNRWLPTLLLILAALGVPAAAIGFFTHFVTTHPLLATIIGVLYEAVIVILGFMGKIWDKLESRWVDRIADWVDQWVLGFFSRYHKTYCTYLGYQHRDFDVKGLSLQGTYTMELGQVFIELSIDPTTVQEMSANPLQIPKALMEGGHSIWDYLSSEPLANQQLVLVGPPGSGKTTLLKHITLILLAHGKQRHQHQAKVPLKLPVLLFLRDHANAIHSSENFVNLVQFFFSLPLRGTSSAKVSPPSSSWEQTSQTKPSPARVKRVATLWTSIFTNGPPYRTVGTAMDESRDGYAQYLFGALALFDALGASIPLAGFFQSGLFFYGCGFGLFILILIAVTFFRRLHWYPCFITRASLDSGEPGCTRLETRFGPEFKRLSTKFRIDLRSIHFCP